MADVKRVGPLELGQDLPFQRWQWSAQRWGWLALVLVVVAALLGLLGSGPLSGTSAENADGSLRVEYDRFLRRGSPATLRVRLNPGPTPDGTVRLCLDEQYLRHVQILQITPRPEREEAGRERHRFVFRLAEGGPTDVSLHFEAAEAGPLSCRADLGAGPAVEFGHLVYP